MSNEYVPCAMCILHESERKQIVSMSITIFSPKYEKIRKGSSKVLTSKAFYLFHLQ